MVAGGLCISALSAWGHAESLAVLAGRADTHCIDASSTGQVCRRASPPYVGIKMRYWQPVLLVETVKRPGDTVVNEFRSYVGQSLRQAVAAAMHVEPELVDSGSSGSIDTTFVQMNDVHVFGFPFSDIFSGGVEPVCEGPPDFTGIVSYLTELDAVEWRTMKNEKNHWGALITNRVMPRCDGSDLSISGLCMGVWGALYPRGGFVSGYSPAVGSAAAAFRAVSIAADPVISLHRRLIPIQFSPNILWDRMQMVYPGRSGCLEIGEDPRYWEDGKVSSDGKYAWIYWRKKECCLF